MALGDPFSTTYEGARQGLGTLGEAINLIAQQYYQRKQKKQEQMMDILTKLFPYTRPTTYTYTDKATGEPVTYTIGGEQDPELTNQVNQMLYQFLGMKPLRPKKEVIDTTATVEKEPLQLPPGMAITQTGKTTKIAPIPETPEQKQAREVETERLKKAEEVRAESEAVDNMVESVWNASNRLIPAPKDIGEAERLGWERKAKTLSIFGLRPQRAFGISDEGALAFEQTKKAEATPLIRAMGEKGMLTNQDIQRAYELMPSFSDSKILRDTKKIELNKFLKSRIDAYYKPKYKFQQPTQQNRITPEQARIELEKRRRGQ